MTFVLVVALFAGCDSKDKDVLKIGLVQLMEHPSLDTIRESIIEGLADEGYVDGENIEINYQNGQNDMTTMKNIAQTFVGDECDVIIAIATPAAQAALSETTDIPIIFAAITDPVGAGLVDSLDEPGGNVTGTSDEVSAEMIMNLAKDITPGFKTIGALYNIGEDNSVSVIKGLKDYAKANGFKVVESTVKDSSEVKQAAQYLADKGLTEKTVIYSHAWRNALIPVVSLVVGWFLGIFGGSLVIEDMFALNGMGKLMIVSLRTADYEVVMFMQMFYVGMSLLGNLIIDLVYGLVDPRVRVNK